MGVSFVREGREVSAASLSLSVWNNARWPVQRRMHRDRMRSAFAVVLVHLLLGYGLVTSLSFTRPIALDEPLKLFDIAAEPPPAPEPALRAQSDRAEGAAAPPNLESRPKPMVAPPPRIRIEIAQQLGAAPIAGAGRDNSAGASVAPGPGTGAGGVGSGPGSGGAGTGPGSGGVAVRARHLRGRIDDSDYPRSAYRQRIGGTVTVRIGVGADGRVSRCTLAQSSGHAELDQATCRLIERRFRYEPARDAAGRPVADELGWRQIWWLEPR